MIGAGLFFDYYEKPENLIIINATLSHAELIKKLQISKAALLLTKNDTQGVMSYEIASTAMLLITSGIKVCREVFSCFENVKLV